MNAYGMICKTNRALIQKQEISDDQKQDIVSTLLSAIDTPAVVRSFHRRVRASKENLTMYPLFYILQYAGRKKPRLITGYLTQTHILSTNHYELEILRLLALWGSDNVKVAEMIDHTLNRLDTTCFGHFCAKGECVGASVAVLRFLSAVKPVDKIWVDEILKQLADLFTGTKGQASTRNNLPIFYFCLALSGIESDLAVQIIQQRKHYLLALLKKGWLTEPMVLDTFNSLRKYVIRNTLACLPEYTHLKNAEIYVSEKDGRCYCDV